MIVRSARKFSPSEWGSINQTQSEWEEEKLDVDDGEGLDDRFTLADVSEIIAGRFKRQSSNPSTWSTSFATVSRYSQMQKGCPAARAVFFWAGGTGEREEAIRASHASR